MDGRNTYLRPRTTKETKLGRQPEGWPGIDQFQQQPFNPLRTFETPLVFFPGDILVPALTIASIPLPERCAQIAFIDLIPGVQANINGGGYRTIKDGFVYNGAFQSLEVQTDAVGSVRIQLAGW